MATKAKQKVGIGSDKVESKAVAPARKRTTKTTAKKKAVRKPKKVSFSVKAKNALVYAGYGIANFGYASKAVVASGLRKLADVID